jgi:1-deoxy-D-xylulose-5-phosphate reductoisomerase
MRILFCEVDRPLTRLAILGSTGSVGRQTLDVVRAHPERFEVVALAGGRNVESLAQQVAEFHPRYVCCAAEGLSRPAGAQLASLNEIATLAEVDVVMNGVVGNAGLEPSLQALAAGKALALANKEAMVMAGGLLTAAAAASGAQIRPVDSEHSAIWQCLAGEEPHSVSKLVLTASGGAFRDLPPEQLESVTPEEALKHPTWQMGKRITVDSAGLFNKGLEVIEARWLFDIPYERIDIVLHRESVIHSMVEFVDGSFKAQLASPDMKGPIQYALTYPDRLPVDMKPLDFASLGALHFGSLDLERYPCLGLALAAGRKGGTYPAAIAAADEEAVAGFLQSSLKFTDIPHLLSDAMDAHDSREACDLATIMEADAWGRRFARNWMETRTWTS